MNLGTSYSGTPPNGAAPWLTATFADQGLNLVRLTLTATFLNGSEDVKEWGFNINPALNASLGSLTFTHISGATAAAFSKSVDNINEGPSHDYDFQFDWGSGSNSVFTAGVSSVYDLGGISGLNANSFNFASNGSGGHYFSAAHVQNTGSDFEGSAWIGAPGSVISTVPEPTHAGLLMLGVALLGSVAVRRRRAHSN